MDSVNWKRESISVVLTLYKRPEALKKQIEAIKNQSVKPMEILLFHDHVNCGETVLLDSNLRKEFDVVVEPEENKGVWGRFRFAYETARGKYICVLDDDTIPGLKWLETCLNLINRRNAIYASLGICLTKYARYPYHDGFYRIGWCSANNKCEEVDFAGHSWFFNRECLQWMFTDTERYQEIKTAGEDMNLSVRAKEHGIPTIITPHPIWNKEIWGSIPYYAMSYGNSNVATGINGNYYNMNKSIIMLEDEGWRPMYRDHMIYIKSRQIKQKLYLKIIRFMGLFKITD